MPEYKTTWVLSMEAKDRTDFQERMQKAARFLEEELSIDVVSERPSQENPE